MPLKLFVEYRIKAEEQASFEALAPRLSERMRRLGVEGYGLYAGTDQPLIYVEEGAVPDLESFLAVKKALLHPEDALGRSFLAMLDGGPSRLHVWAFRPVGSA